MKMVKATDMRLETSPSEQIKEIELVRGIIADVRKNGDTAVRKYNKKFDGADITTFEITQKQINQAYRQVDTKTISALRKAARNIRLFAKAQFKDMKNFTVTNNGVTLGQKIVPIERVGCYVPGGRY